MSFAPPQGNVGPETLSITQLSDVAAKSGTGTTVLFQGSPTITTPTIGSFANSAHNHRDAAGGDTLDHGLALIGLTDDDHTQYALLVGRAGGQVLVGGTAASESITIRATSNATDGAIIFNSDPTTRVGSFLSTGELIVGSATAPISAELLSVQRNANSVTDFRMQNTTSGTAAQTRIVLDASAANLVFGVTSASFTTSGMNVQDGSYITSSGASGGLHFGVTDNNPVVFYQNSSEAFRLDTTTGSITMAEARNISFGATTGTKIGTATSQKLGFYNATPIIQGASIADASGGAVIDAEARTAINALISRIESLGLIATV